MKQLLVLACSARKHGNLEVMPAIERYDGVAFRMLKKTPYDTDNVDIMILSAKYGLLYPSQYIPDYNLKMRSDIVPKLKPQVHQVMAEALQRMRYDIVVLSMSQLYTTVFDQFVWPSTTTVYFVPGGIGVKLGFTKRWLVATQTGQGREFAKHQFTRINQK